MSYSHL